MVKINAYVLFFGFTLVSIGAVYASAPSNQTAIEWAIFKSQDMAFTIQRPQEWKVLVGHGKGSVSPSVEFYYRLQPKRNVWVTVMLVQNDYLASVETSEQGLKELYQPGALKSIRTLDGVSATEIEGSFQSQSSGRMLTLYSKKNGKIYHLTFSVPDAALWKEYQPIFEAMLASFKSLR